jgi:hypothetical protein
VTLSHPCDRACAASVGDVRAAERPQQPQTHRVGHHGRAGREQHARRLGLPTGFVRGPRFGQGTANTLTTRARASVPPAGARSYWPRVCFRYGFAPTGEVGKTAHLRIYLRRWASKTLTVSGHAPIHRSAWPPTESLPSANAGPTPRNRRDRPSGSLSNAAPCGGSKSSRKKPLNSTSRFHGIVVKATGGRVPPQFRAIDEKTTAASVPPLRGTSRTSRSSSTPRQKSSAAETSAHRFNGGVTAPAGSRGAQGCLPPYPPEMDRCSAARSQARAGDRSGADSAGRETAASRRAGRSDLGSD